MFRKLLSLDEAKERVEEEWSPKPVETEQIPLSTAAARVLASDVVSPINVPPFHRSTVDGYAVEAGDTFGADEDNPKILEFAGSVNVGEISSLALNKGTAIEIVTGAPLPANANAVVMVENTAEKDEKILVFRAAAKDENVLKMGLDIKKGETVLKRGEFLSSSKLGVLAALGFSHVKVYKRPKAAIVSTGSEIVEPGKPLPAGKIYDINTYTLTAAVLESGGEPVGFGIVRDDNVETLKTALRKALDTTDFVITTGGVSVGPKDVIPRIVGELGKPGLVVHGVTVKPGKPTAVAVVDNKAIFSLPGHPTSSLLMFHLIVRPLLLRMAHRREQPCATVKAVTTEKLFSAPGRRTFITVNLSRDKNKRWFASPVSPGQSGAITTLAKADGYVELKETEQFIKAGETVAVSLFEVQRN